MVKVSQPNINSQCKLIGLYVLLDLGAWQDQLNPFLSDSETQNTLFFFSSLFANPFFLLTQKH